jgi:hypothetical protein
LQYIGTRTSTAEPLLVLLLVLLLLLLLLLFLPATIVAAAYITQRICCMQHLPRLLKGGVTRLIVQIPPRAMQCCKIATGSTGTPTC